MRLLLALCVLFSSDISFAAVDQSSGLILNFRAGRELHLTSVSATARVAAPRSGAGAMWSAVAADRSGAVLWTRPFPAPRAFHGAPDEDLTFSIAIPRVVADATLTIRDEHDGTRWSQVIDAKMLGTADAMSAKTAESVDSAYMATAQLQAAGIAEPLLRQLELQRATDAAAGRRDAVDSSRATATQPVKNLAANGTPAYTVTGSVTDAGPIRVRAFDAASGRFVVSTIQVWYSQRFELPLAAGTYVFEYDDNLENIGSDFFYRTPTRTPPIRISANTELPAITRDTAAGEFSLLAQVPCALIAPNAYLATFMEVSASDGAHIERPAKLDWTSAQGASGQCEARYLIQLSPGVYTIAASPLGWEPRRFGAVQIVSGQRVEQTGTFAAADRTMVWRGTVVDASGQSIANATVIADDQLQGGAWAPWPDAAGRFEIPYRKGWAFQFEPPWWTTHTSYVRRVYAMDGTPPPSTIVIDDLALDSVMDDGLIRLYGNGDRDKRFNILFLAEGYTDVRETFTDTNENGTWDGFLWYDFDKDGVYSNADRLQSYGSHSSYPTHGSVPTAGNEPFTDLNGDGVLSLDDPALFMVKARDFMRSLLGSDFWSEHRDAFNAYALFEPSAQAGYSIQSATGEPLVTRNTLYGASLDQSRNRVTLNRAAAMERALAVLPEVDLVVVLVNDPVWTGARGNVTLSRPGSMIYMAAGYGRLLDDMGPAHEMGHFVGSLCDEYDEFMGVNPNGSTSIRCPNASYSANPSDVPWATWIPRLKLALPTRNLDASIGIYEGADYYPGGAYRPSYRSTMRDLSMLFNAPSRAALLRAVQNRTGSASVTPPRYHTPPFVPLPANQIFYSRMPRP